MIHKIIITGATGNIGRAVMRSKISKNYHLHVIVRNTDQFNDDIFRQKNVTCHAVGDLAQCDTNDLAETFRDASCIIHLAAIVSRSNVKSGNVTADIAENVAAACYKANVRNIINLSSIAARLAEENRPQSRVYGHQKLAAEQCFLKRCESVAAITNLRPPAVYGSQVDGAISKLTSLLHKGIPLPVGLAKSNRDYISIANLVDLIWTIAEHKIEDPRAPGMKTFEPCDGRSIDTRSLIELLADAMGVKARMLPVPPYIVQTCLRIFRKRELADGIFEPLQATGNSDLEADFGWRPFEKMPASLGYLSPTSTKP